MDEQYFEGLDEALSCGMVINSFCKLDDANRPVVMASKINEDKEEMVACIRAGNVLSALDSVSDILMDENFSDSNDSFDDTYIDVFLRNGCKLKFVKYDNKRIMTVFSWGGLPLKIFLSDNVRDSVVLLDEELKGINIEDVINYYDNCKEKIHDNKRRIK